LQPARLSFFIIFPAKNNLFEKFLLSYKFIIVKKQNEMSLIKNWNRDELLVLSFMLKMNWQVLFKVVHDFDSLKDLIESPYLPSYFSSNNKQGSLFDANIEDERDNAKIQIDTCRENGFEILTYWDEDYPNLLKEILHPPAILYILGKMSKADSFSISIVGTRRNTMYGKITAERFAEYFATRNIIITSGMANGIDTISHKAAIKAKGVTYAVIASGLDTISSYYHRQTAEKIVDSGGAVISEYPCGVKALPPYFLQRNRLISGISKATIVVESAFKGGALNTARYAFEQQREVYAVPGRLSDEKSEGTNRLIRKNVAAPALTPEEILEDLGIDNDAGVFNTQIARNFDSPDEEKIFNTLNMEPMQIDDIANKSGLSVSALNVKLLEMEFKGMVKSLPGKHYIRL
jgi:DNA processing protein